MASRDSRDLCITYFSSSSFRLHLSLYVYVSEKMAHDFTFGFASEDIDGEDNDLPSDGQPAPVEHIEPLGNPPELHTVDELVSGRLCS